MAANGRSHLAPKDGVEPAASNEDTLAGAIELEDVNDDSRVVGSPGCPSLGVVC